MSHLTRLFCSVTALFCAHEWARRVEGRRVYLECMHCLSTTPGFDLGRKPAGAGGDSRGQKHLNAIEAA